MPLILRWSDQVKFMLVRNDQTHFRNLAANATRFLKFVWPFQDKLLGQIKGQASLSWGIEKHLFQWLYVLVMSRTRIRVNPHSIVAWTSRNSLLEAGAKSEVYMTASGLDGWVFVYELSGSGFKSSCSNLNFSNIWNFCRSSLFSGNTPQKC